MKASDYIAEFLAQAGVSHVFGLTGAHALHLIDSIARHPSLTFVPCLHEQGAAFAADAYARISGKLGVVVSTSGPGAVNLLSGACASYFDSIPVLFLTGQVASNQLKGNSEVRQKGFQETDVLGIFSPVTKAFDRITPASLSRYLAGSLRIAFRRALGDRPGPVLLDIPDDVQRADISVPLPSISSSTIVPKESPDLSGLWNAFQSAQRPLVVMGAGVRIAGCQAEAQRFIDRLGPPALLTWGGMDLLPASHSLNMGGFGTCGPKAGNLALSQSDLILILGARIGAQNTGSQPFAPQARKIMVDIDPHELARFVQEWPGMGALCCGLREFFFEANSFITLRPAWVKFPVWASWRDQLAAWRKEYPVGPGCPDDGKQKGLDPYVFIQALSDAAGPGDIIITDAGATLCWTMQTWQVKEGQRLISAWNHSPMGYAVPAAIGAAVAAPNKRIIVITGDGSFQMNAQELATIGRLNLNVHIFVLDNGGYGIIRQTQDTWLEGRHAASENLGLPNSGQVAAAYCLPHQTLFNRWALAGDLADYIDSPGPKCLRVMIRPDARIVPKLGPGQKLEEIE